MQQSLLDMTLDQMIAKFNQTSQVGLVSPIKNWRWHGCPGPYAKKEYVPSKLDWAIYHEICKALISECEHSSSEYVREAKKWPHGAELPKNYDLLAAARSARSPSPERESD